MLHFRSRSYAIFGLQAVLIMAALAMLSSCGLGGSGDGGEGGSSTSALSLVRQNGSISYHSTSAATAALTPSNFDLGTISVSTTYLFVLENAGTSTVTSVHLTSNNPAVIISPATIDSIPPAGQTGFFPIIQVQILHGVGPNGFAAAPTLPAGRFDFTISASGHNDIGAVSMTASMSAFVQVASYVVRANGEDPRTVGPTIQQIDINGGTIYTLSDFHLPNMLGDQGAALSQLTPAPQLSGPPQYLWDGPVQVTNTGNVPITVTAYFGRDSFFSTVTTAGTPITISPGQTMPIPAWTVLLHSSTADFVSTDAFVIGSDYIDTGVILAVDSHQTVFSSDSVPAQNDGIDVMMVDFGLSQAPTN